jgi:GNAT superfamily N-acetyltransferase
MPGLLVRDFAAADLAWVVARHRDLYRAEYGWDASFADTVEELLVAQLRRDDPLREAGWIADCDGRRSGCVFCMRGSDDAAQLRALLVEPDARRAGVGRALVSTCVAFARGAGYRRIELWTTANLTAAAALYDAAGFELVDEWREQRFGVRLVSRRLRLELEP